MNPPQGVRVCQIISSFYPLVGGAEQATLRLSQGLAALGAEVVVLTRRHPGLKSREVVEGVEVWRLGLPTASKLGAFFFIAHVLWTLVVRLRSWRVLHSQGTDAQLISGLIARVFLRRRLVLTIHSDPRLKLRITKSGGGARFNAVRDHVDAVGVLGPHMVEPLVSEGISPNKILELSNGVDIQRFCASDEDERRVLRHDLGLAPDTLMAVFVGRLIPLKRVDLLLKAWLGSGVATNGVLFILGDGPEADKLKSLSESLGGSVRFLGNHGAPEEVLRAADLFVLPSQREGQSMALLEAMACGLVPIVSDLDSNLDVVEEGETGFSFATDDQASFEAALLRGARCDHGQIGSAAMAQVQARNSLQVTARTHFELYNRLSRSEATR